MRDDRIILFTDGSFRRGRMGAGYLAHDGRRMAYGCAPAGTDGSSILAEALALDLGVRRALRAFPRARHVDVLTDSDATVRVVRGWMRASEAQAAILGPLDADLRAAGAVLAMHWTPSHLDEGTAPGFANAVVDRLAGLGAHGRRLSHGLSYGPGWAHDLRRRDPALAGLPRQVGREVAAAWLGIAPEFVGELLAHGHLQAAEAPGLVSARSVDRVRRHAVAMGLAPPDPAAWAPGPLLAPAPLPDALAAIAAFRAGGLAGAGAVIAVGGDTREASCAVTPRDCPHATAVDAATAMPRRACSGLAPLTRLQIAVADERLFRLLARLDPPPGKAARLALGRFAAAGDALRLRVVVAHARPGPGRAVRMLERAGRLALAAAGPAPDSVPEPVACEGNVRPA